jgi:hypothetical protein
MVNTVAELSRLTEPRKSLASPPLPYPTPHCIILDMTHHFLVQLWHVQTSPFHMIITETCTIPVVQPHFQLKALA